MAGAFSHVGDIPGGGTSTSFDSSLSSLDPLALPSPSSASLFGSPLRDISGNKQRFAAQRTPTRPNNSPSKSVLLTSGQMKDGSPWKIRVTVEAETEEPQSVKGNITSSGARSNVVRATTRTIKVPLKDHGIEVAGRTSNRSRTPVGRRNQAGTPVASRRRSVTGVASDEDSPDDSADGDFSLRNISVRGRGSRTKTKATGRTRNEITAVETECNASLLQEKTPEQQSLVQHNKQADSKLKAFRTTGTLSNPQDSSSASKLANPVHAQRSSVGKDLDENQIAISSDESDQGDDVDESIAPADHDIGEQTMLESQDFSMVSLDSIESARDAGFRSSPVSKLTDHHLKSGQENMTPQKDRQTLRPFDARNDASHLLTPSDHGSIVTGSGGNPSHHKATSAHRCITPAYGLQPSLEPPRIEVAQPEHIKVATPKIAKVAGIGSALQGVLQTSVDDSEAGRLSDSMSSSRKDRSLLHGFSADTRRQLRASLRLGEELADSSPCPQTISNGREPSLTSSAITVPESAKMNIQNAMQHQAEIVRYPDLPTVEATSGSEETNSYDDMSWRATTPPKVAVYGIDTTHINSSSAQQSLSANKVPQRKETVECSSPKPDNQAHATYAADKEDVDLSKLEDLFSDDSTARISRPKISRTWRRRSSSGFAYRDEPPLSPPSARRVVSSTVQRPSLTGFVAQKDASPKQLPSPQSSRTSVTPTPSLESGAEEQAGDSASPDESVRTPISSPCSDNSVMTDDTGLFWHKNLPNIYAKPGVRRSGVNQLKSGNIDLTNLIQLSAPLPVSPFRSPERSPLRSHLVLTPARGLESPTKSLFGTVQKSALKQTKSVAYDVESRVPKRRRNRVSWAEFDETREITEESLSLESDLSDVEHDESLAQQQLQNDILASTQADLQTEGDMTVTSVDKSVSVDDSALDATDASVGEGEDVYEVEASEVSGEIIDEDTESPLSSRQSSPRSNVSVSSVTQRSSPASCDRTVESLVSVVTSVSATYRTSNSEPVRSGYSRADATVYRDSAPTYSVDESKGSGLIGRWTSKLWFALPSLTPAEPTDDELLVGHPLLAKQKLLPRVEPWTKSHYKTLHNLYQMSLRHPQLFDPAHPDNACLAPVLARRHTYTKHDRDETYEWSFEDWVDVDVQNWGYRVTLGRADIVIAALFSQLLALRDAGEYERLHGREIEVGECNPGKTGCEIGVDKIVLRLFSIVLGGMVRADEAKGVPIDRSPGNGWLRRKATGKWENFM